VVEDGLIRGRITRNIAIKRILMLASGVMLDDRGQDSVQKRRRFRDWRTSGFIARGSIGVFDGSIIGTVESFLG